MTHPPASEDQMKLSPRQIADYVLWALIIVSVGFGFFKQIKTACHSIDSMMVYHEDAGASIRFLRDRLFSLQSSQKLRSSRFSYVSDRQDRFSERPVEQFYYAAEYAFAPYSFSYQEPQADFYMLDFVSKESLRDYLAKNSLEVIAVRGLYTLAKKKQAGK